MRRKLFPSQLEDEQINLVVREHWIFLILRFLIVVFLFALLLAFQAYFPNYVPALFEGQAGKIVTLFTQIYTLGLIMASFLIWVFYYLNIQVITNIRIVDIDQQGLFRHTVSELHIDKMEDVTSDSKGILATIFNFGDVYVQTAGTVERFEFHRVPAPDQIEKLILDLYERRPQSNPPSSL